MKSVDVKFDVNLIKIISESDDCKKADASLLKNMICQW